MMRIKLFLLVDILMTLIFSAYLYFTRGTDAAFLTGLSIFIAFSPICLIAATPFVFRLAKKRVAEEEITMNNPDAILNLAEIDTVAVPMNRFLTDGDYFVTDLVPEGLSQSSLLANAASVEKEAQHILGKKIFDTAIHRALRLQPTTDFREIPGHGAEALMNNNPIRVGNPQWIEKQGVSISAELLTKIDQLAVHGKIVLLLGMGKMARGIIALKDDINQKGKDFLHLLKRRKLETVLLTAAAKKTANKIAKSFSLDYVRTNLSPTDKAREVQILRTKGHNIAVVANEFHDLPALLDADISVLLSDGSTEPVILSNGVNVDFEISSLEKFLTLHDISLRAAELIKTNKKLAYLSWILLVPLAVQTALENPPIFFHPLMSVAGVTIFTILILLNSLKMNKKNQSV